MKYKYEYDGLCANCIYAINCNYRKYAKNTIHQCELYECIEEKEAQDNISKNTEVEIIKEKNEIDPSLKGLCSNCKNRDTCKLKKPISGVWYCEEYL